MSQPSITWEEAKRQTRRQLHGETSENNTKPKAEASSNGQNGKDGL